MRTRLAVAVSAVVLVFVIASAVQAADLTAKATGFKDGKGGAIFYLWRSAEGFPKTPDKAYAKQAIEIKDGSATVVFTGLEPGVYAVSLAHDQNGNGKLDTGFMGKPKEGYGTSNNPKNKLSAPSFDQCRVSVGAEGKTIDIQVIY